MKRPLRILLDGLIDYAGLFPPAALPMADAARNYAAYRRSSDAFALGRFIVPAARLDELGPFDGPLSVLIGAEVEDDFAAVRTRGLDTVEVRAVSVEGIEQIARAGAGLTLFVEIAPDRFDLLDAIARLGLRAKIRTGGVVASAFPEPAVIVRFIAACVERRIAFKATAGLHHPLRCVRPLTYEADAPSGTMHGFVNLLLAAALLSQQPAALAPSQALLEERDPAAFTITDDAFVWRGTTLDAATLQHVRKTLALSFGSCSFEEPLGDLRALGWL